MNSGAVQLANGSAPLGLTAIGLFLIFGACMASLAGLTLIWPGTIFGRMWSLNSRAYRELAPFGKTVGIPFLLFGVFLAVASFGWFKRRVWGWWLTVIIVGTQVLGNSVNLYLGRIWEGILGVAIAGGLTVYLLRVKVRTMFGSKHGLLPEVND
jgi:hypothetical protein